MYYSENQAQKSTVSRFMYKVYGWMSLGLAVTAGLSYYLSETPAFMQAILTNSWLLLAIIIFQFGLVLALSMLVTRMNFATAVGFFLLYAASVALTLAPIFLIYTTASIYLTFVTTAGMFGVMSLYGYFTQDDLTSVGSISMMALIGIIIASLVNLFLKSQVVDYVISGIGVLVFTALTAYDVQKIKQMAYQLMGYEQMRDNIAIVCALTLYLDFINLFLFLLRFLGHKKDE
jgi:FtsH-binding integral membrane protein